MAANICCLPNNVINPQKCDNFAICLNFQVFHKDYFLLVRSLAIIALRGFMSFMGKLRRALFVCHKPIGNMIKNKVCNNVEEKQEDRDACVGGDLLCHTVCRHV